jgi:hypothetical protein
MTPHDHPAVGDIAAVKKAAADAIAQDDLLIDLRRAARLLGAPNASAVYHRMRRGTRTLRTEQFGGKTAPLLVWTADVYAELGLTWTPPNEDESYGDAPALAATA